MSTILDAAYAAQTERFNRTLNLLNCSEKLPRVPLTIRLTVSRQASRFGMSGPDFPPFTLQAVTGVLSVILIER